MKIYSLLTIYFLLLFSCKQSSKTENTTPIDTVRVVLSLVDSLAHIPLDSTAVQKQKDLISFFNEKYLLAIKNDSIDESSNNIKVNRTHNKEIEAASIELSLPIAIKNKIKRSDFEAYFGIGGKIVENFIKSKQEQPYLVDLSDRSYLQVHESRDYINNKKIIDRIVILKHKEPLYYSDSSDMK